MVKLNAKISASTLIEAIVAMLIIVIVYGIGIMIFMNVKKSANNGLKLEAILQVENILSQTKKEAKYVDENFDFDNLKIEKKILKYDNASSLNILEIKALSNDNKVLTEHREIIKVNK